MRAWAELVRMTKNYGPAQVARATGLTRSTLTKLGAGQSIRTKKRPTDLLLDAKRFEFRLARVDLERRKKLRELQEAIFQEGGLRAAARKLGVDPSNLAKQLNRLRQAGRGGLR